MFPSPSGDGPLWPLTSAETAKYRVGVQAVTVDLDDESFEMKSNIIDGHNVRENVRMVKVENIQTFDFTVTY